MKVRINNIVIIIEKSKVAADRFAEKNYGPNCFYKSQGQKDAKGNIDYRYYMPSYISNEQRSSLLERVLADQSSWFALGSSSIQDINRIASRKNVSEGRKIYMAILSGHTLVVQHRWTGEYQGIIGLQQMLIGEDKMLREDPQNFADLMTDDITSKNADIWVRYCTLGKYM